MTSALALDRDGANNGVFSQAARKLDLSPFQMWEIFAVRGMKKWSYSAWQWKFLMART